MIEPGKHAAWPRAVVRVAVTDDSRQHMGLSVSRFVTQTALQANSQRLSNRRITVKKSLLLATSLLVLIAATGSAFAQSTNRDHPTPFTSNEINGELKGQDEEIEYFYSFTAGQGEVTITVDVKSSGGTTGTAFELLDADANKVLICCEGAQADSSGTTGRDVVSINLAKRQTVILHLTPFKYGTGTYRVRINGAVALSERRQR
jgi:hypothetical protein